MEDEKLYRILELGIKETYKKGDLLLTEGALANKLFYIEKGLVRVFYLKDGKEVTDWFGVSGNFVTSIMGFYGEVRSTRNIEVLEDSVVYTIKKSEIEEAIDEDIELGKLYREVIINHLMRLEQRITALQFYTAAEKYDLLLNKNPYVIQRAARTHIASYLGISLETLSRMSQR